MLAAVVFWLAYVTTALGVLLVALYGHASYKLSYWKRKGIPTPPTNLIFGNFKDTLTFRKPPGQVLRDIYESANPDAPYIGFYIFHKPMLLLRSPDLIKQIMVKDFHIFPNRRFGGDGEKDSVGLINLLSIKHPKWKYLRTKLTPTLTGQKLRKMVPLMQDCGVPMINYISNKSNEAGWKEFELKDLCSRYSTDVISSLAFGITTNSFDEKDTDFWKAGQRVLTGLKRGIILLVHFFMPELSGFLAPMAKKPAEFFRMVFWDSMNTRERVGNKRGDLIDSFLTLKNGEQNPEFKFEGDNLLAQAVAFYIAGFEATSTTTAFTLFELAHYPEYQTRVYEEIKRVIDSQGLTLESINDMTYLDQVVNESLRLHPPLPLIDRIAEQEYEIQDTGLVLEKNIPVYVSINAINHDPKYFKNPEEFIPGREKSNDILGASMAFGVGPRSCVGQRIGQIITKMAVITIVLKYRLSYKLGNETSLNPLTVFTTAANGIYVQLEERK
ncbi:cytochrome P450 6k1-like [Orussus abietinus]|uniref:cytochrome P450 6k1-like n=1 Tax=Orussus abietinus TaxID=222816 RepID=UPI000624FD1E|nr:cytochrome P450 6k1-like [Orussus abietinus]XP_012278034.1 cytochrome P450 6k1-like [Orussus abietinus]